jgi:repressor of nif and glnA expression
LEAIESDEDGVRSVGDLHENDYIRISKTQISRRCQKLNEHGLLRKIGHGVYMITEEGGAYLEEEYDAERGVYMNRDVSGGESRNGADSTSDV